MIAAWLAGKLSGILIFILACLAPIFFVAWLWEAVALHGIAIPGPTWLGGPWELVHGALFDTNLANARADKAIDDLGVAQANEAQLRNGLDACNASVDSLAKAGKTWQDAAQALVDRALAGMRPFADGAAAVSRIKPTDEKCPVVDTIFKAGVAR